MSVRSLTTRLREELSESRRRDANPAPAPADAAVGTAPSTDLPASGALYKGRRPEAVPEPEAPVDVRPFGLRPRAETPPSAIPGGIADRFRLKSQRVSDIDRSIDAYTSQISVSAPEADNNRDSADSDSAPITIELQSH